MPIPPDAPIEGGSWLTNTGDRHVLAVNTFDCKLHELYHAFSTNNGWDAGSGAIFDSPQCSAAPRRLTSADAAGLAILPGLARYDEVASGAIYHALRFTTNCTAGKTWPRDMWRRLVSAITLRLWVPVRLVYFRRQPFVVAADESDLDGAQAVWLILADNGSRWYINGNAGWDDAALVPQLAQVKGSDFEVVDSSSLMVDMIRGRRLSSASLPALLR
jgi:hypothetical protein